MAKRAVLVGCNYPGTKAELHGCINDVNRIHRTLIQRFGFPESDITILIDTDRQHRQPTGANIKRSLHNLVSEARPGDVLFFHYSGHGARVATEPDDIDETGHDECIVTSDAKLINGMCPNMTQRPYILSLKAKVDKIQLRLLEQGLWFRV